MKSLHSEYLIPVPVFCGKGKGFLSLELNLFLELLTLPLKSVVE